MIVIEIENIAKRQSDPTVHCSHILKSLVQKLRERLPSWKLQIETVESKADKYLFICILSMPCYKAYKNFD